MKKRVLRVRDGNLIPIGNNFAYVSGDHPNKTDDVDIGNMSVDNGEVLKFTNNGVYVYSAQPILNGISPARYVLGGGDPNAVFAAQERYKDIHHLRDDGRHAKVGDKINNLEFQNWYSKIANSKGLSTNPYDKEHYYDYLGYYNDKIKTAPYTLESMRIMFPYSHFPDTYKLPGHPTFSNESIYSTPEHKGGHWEGNTFIDSEYTASYNKKKVLGGDWVGKRNDYYTANKNYAVIPLQGNPEFDITGMTRYNNYPIKTVDNRKPILDALWAMENPYGQGLNRDGSYGSYGDPNGSDQDVGPGIILSNLPVKKSYTKDELEDYAYTKILEGRDKIRQSFDEKYGQGEYDKLDDARKYIMDDVRYRYGTVSQSEWPNLYQAIYDNDVEKALTNARTKFKNKKGEVIGWDNGRIERLAQYFYPDIVVEHKGNKDTYLKVYKKK